MRHSWIAVLAGLPLIAGAALPPLMVPLLPVRHQQAAPLVEVNFIDRILQESKPRKRSTAHRRPARSSSAQAAQPAPAAPPAPAVIPVPTPRPQPEGQVATEPAQSQAPAAATPPAPPQPATDTAPAPAPQTPPPTVEQPGTAAEPPHAAEVPTPQPKPGEKAPAEAPPSSPATPPVPADAPVPAPAPAAPPQSAPPGETAPPQAPAPQDQGQQPAEPPKPEEPPKPAEPPAPPIAKEDPDELKACLADLSAIGGKFKEIASIDEGEGCGIDKPLEVAEVLPGVEVGGAVMRCKTALSLAHWIRDTTQPALDIARPGRRITGLVPGSTYACRLRNSAATGKISEHAHGNAFDVAAFKLDNGDQMEMKPRDDDHTLEGAFQKTATAGACLHFTTVLAPGSDEAHENHLHLDVMERNNGYRICE